MYKRFSNATMLVQANVLKVCQKPQKGERLLQI